MGTASVCMSWSLVIIKMVLSICTTLVMHRAASLPLTYLFTQSPLLQTVNCDVR